MVWLFLRERFIKAQFQHILKQEFSEQGCFHSYSLYYIIFHSFQSYEIELL